MALRLVVMALCLSLIVIIDPSPATPDLYFSSYHEYP